METITGLTKEDQKLTTTAPIEEVIQYDEKETAQPHLIKCRDGQLYVLDEPLQHKFTVKVIDMLGPYGNHVEGGQAIHLQVARYLKNISLDVRSRFMTGTIP